MSKRFYSNRPRLVEDKILDSISLDYAIKIQSSNGEYLRLKTTPSLKDEIVTSIMNKFHVGIKKFVAEDSCILEIEHLVFDIIVVRDTSNFPNLNGWILQVVKNQSHTNEVEVIATLKYNKDCPYNFAVAEHLITYLNSNEDDLNLIDYEEIFLI